MLFLSVWEKRKRIETDRRTAVFSSMSSSFIIPAIPLPITQAPTADILYRQLEVPLNRIVRVMKLMLVFTLAAGVTITSILLCMWMRSRKREIAVFISMGKKKTDILMQVFMETAAVFCFS